MPGGAPWQACDKEIWDAVYYPSVVILGKLRVAKDGETLSLDGGSIFYDVPGKDIVVEVVETRCGGLSCC